MFYSPASQYFPHGPKLGITVAAAVIVISKSPIIQNKMGKLCEEKNHPKFLPIFAILVRFLNIFNRPDLHNFFNKISTINSIKEVILFLSNIGLLCKSALLKRSRKRTINLKW